MPYATPAALNEALRADLARGQNAINLVLDRPTLAGVDADQAEADDVGRGGLSISSVADLAQALDGVDLEATPIYIQASTSALTFTALWRRWCKNRANRWPRYAAPSAWTRWASWPATAGCPRIWTVSTR